MRRLPQRLAAAGLGGAAALLQHLPAPLAYGFADLAWPALAVTVLAHERRVARRGRGAVRNLRIAYRGALTPAAARRLWLAWSRHLAHLAVDFCRMPGIDGENLERHVELAELDVIRDLAAAGDGLVCVSAHAGFWELCGHAATLAGVPVTIVARPLPIAPVDAVVAAIRRSGGQRVLGKWGALWPLVRALRRGEVIGLLADEDERRRPVFAPFLGTPAATTPVPAFLQRATGAPIAVVSCPRIARGRFRLRVWDVIAPGATSDAESDLRATTRAINAALSRAILAHPEQWLWGARRFRTRPPGERHGPDGLPPAAFVGRQPAPRAPDGPAR